MILVLGEAGESGVQSHPQIHRELGDSLGYIKTVSQKGGGGWEYSLLGRMLAWNGQSSRLGPQHSKLGMVAGTLLSQTNKINFLKTCYWKTAKPDWEFCDDAVAVCEAGRESCSAVTFCL